MSSAERWEFWIDRGGTFTDCLGKDPATGTLSVLKLLSSDRAPLDAIRAILRIAADQPIPACDIRMGTTLATNALLERTGRHCALVITRGFGDLLEIGTQARPRLFDLDIKKPQNLYREVLEVDARCDPEGNALCRPDLGAVRRELDRIRKSGLDSVAIVLLHAYRAGELERELGDVAVAAGFSHVALSHEVACELGMLARGETAVIDAYLTPLVRAYVGSLLAELPGSSLRIMQSSGGLTDAARFRGPHAILSGPAAGVVACARIAEELGLRQVIGFDMGGTSTDVSRHGGSAELSYETEIAGVRVRAPMLVIHTVAAGGGSLCRLDGQRLSVGPESAGAAPGPLCYGSPDAVEPTVTDCNLVLGRLLPDRFPFELDAIRPRAALERLSARLAERGILRSAEELADGFFRVANSSMAEAIRRVSVQRGYDARDHALLVFGGAGGQHACALARLLGIKSIVFHPLAGVLSAYGMGLADVVWHGAVDAGRDALDDAAIAGLAAERRVLEERGRGVLADEGFEASRVRAEARVDLRYRGTETSLTLALAGAAVLEREFHRRHAELFGYARPGHTIELVELRMEVVGGHRPLAPSAAAPERSAAPAPARRASLWQNGTLLQDVPVFHRESLTRGLRLAGPALVLDATSTLVLDPGFELEVDADGLLLATDRSNEASETKARDAAALDPVLLEIMGNLFMSVAEQMGDVLRRTALSTNIRERLDFSCAVFDAQGELVANAPHIPVHLGAMGESVRAVVAAHPELLPGDVFATNDPAAGGSHLPDVTVVTPVHDARGRIAFFTASRGHHADIGGTTPGSMPPFSRTLDEEGVVFRALRIVQAGRFERDLVLETLRGARFPARQPAHNLADLEAQIAANRSGARLLGELVEQYGLEAVHAYMQHVQRDAALCVAAQIARMPDGDHRFEDALDDGTPIAVTLHVDGERLRIDFTGSGAEVDSNLNAPRAVTIAAVIYFLRTLVAASIPLNAGCLRPVELVVPEASVLSPGPLAAVAGGNVETSQRIVDVLLAAAGCAAASQGTMNNLTFGDDSFGYYETIAGGAGAGPGFHGASAIHTHMTNTRITDPELLETRFPVRLIEFSVRRGSGGRGRFCGGDGVCRELEFLRPVRVSILSERRTRAPFGLAGGLPGTRGRNLLDGREIAAKVTVDVAAGSRLRIETPGGGGYGA